MTTRRRRRRMFAGIAAAGLVIGFVAGMTTDRIRYDRQRGVALARYEQALHEWRQRQMDFERGTRRDVSDGR